MLAFLLQAAHQVAPLEHEAPTLAHKIMTFLDTPAPYSPFTEYLAVLFLLWLLARRRNDKKDFSREAQNVLEDKFKRGEIDRKTYEKFRQELTMRLKKD